ncbi:hypothetical protein Ahy_A06g026908 [Arachis hypogaea]|uniref:Aminotransferase-like plant mobile domain-containing protein n=1 Tax=Arachis hypogaea TaxID=3818 RepID=A0A445CM32_ARAHY|nr:hypothetical protein Ahy_A06g026908 [Arachis hypogaea]
MQETFGEIPHGAYDATVRRYARAYIMILLGTQLFGDKSETRLHIRWLPYVVRLEDMGGYCWDSAALSWLYRCMCRVANRNVVKLAGPLQLLQSWIFCALEVVQVVHPEILEPRHTSLWRSVTALIYFVVIEWHQVDRLLPQFGGVQPLPRSTLNIDFLMEKDDREPSHDFLDWWAQYGRRFLSPELFFGDPRAVPIPSEATQRGPGRVLDMDWVDDIPDRRRVEWRARVGTRRSGREFQLLDQAIEERGRVRRRHVRGGRDRP